MNVYRKQTVKRTPDVERRTIHSQKFYGTLRLVPGKRKEVPLTDEQETSKALLRELQREQEIA